MAAILWTDVTSFFVADTLLTTVPVAAQTQIVGYVNNHLKISRFDGEDGYDTRLARLYLAAHMGLGCLPGHGTSGGAVSSESGGDGLMVSYSVSPLAALDALGETGYGRRYLSMVRTSCAGGVLL